MDDARDALILEFFYSGVLAAFTEAEGAGETPLEAPRGNLTGDPWFTDGKRAVIFLSNEELEYEDIQYLEWSTLAEPPSEP